MESLVAIDGKPDLQALLVIPVRPMIDDDGFICMSMMLGSAGRRQTPLDKSRSSREGDIVEIDDLEREYMVSTSVDSISKHLTDTYSEDEFKSRLITRLSIGDIFQAIHLLFYFSEL